MQPLLKKIYSMQLRIILIIGGYLQFDWTLSNPAKFKANINLWILSCNNMYIISVCRCAKQRNRNSVCKHKSFTFLGLGSNAGSNYLSLYYTERTLIDKNIWNGSDSSNEESANTCLFCFHVQKLKYCKIFR